MCFDVADVGKCEMRKGAKKGQGEQIRTKKEENSWSRKASGRNAREFFIWGRYSHWSYWMKVDILVL